MLEPMENKEYRGRYPEPWWITNRRTFALIYRGLLGRPMTNVVFTNASFWRDATSGYPSRWLRMAGWKRMSIRVSGAWLLTLMSVLLMLMGLGRMGAHTGPLMSALLIAHVVVLMSIAVPLIAVSMIRAHGLSIPLPLERERFRVITWQKHVLVLGREQWQRERVIPLGRSLAAMLNRPGQHPRDINRWVSVPRSFMSEDGEPVEILLPQGFIAQEKARATIVKTASERLGVAHEMSAQWQLSGEHPRLLLSAPVLPPEKVLMSDVLTWLMSSEEYRPLLGLSGGGQALMAEMVSDSPHIGLSAGPGAGKSTLAKLIIMQALRWGWGVVICDWKMTEAYKWAIGLQGVTYLTDIEDIHDFGVRMGEEVDLRKKAGLEGRAKLLIVRDEWNATSDLLSAYWQDLRATAGAEEKKRMPVKSPALRGFMALDFGGREFGCHDLLIAQRFSARIFNGNADMRECFGIRGLARYTHQTKAMLVGNIKPFPKKSNVPGRWVFVAGESIAEVQVPFITNEQAREYAQGGRPNPLTPLSSCYYPDAVEDDATDATEVEMPPTQGNLLRPDATGRNSAAPQEVKIIDARKLSEMVDGLAPLGVTWNSLRNASRADGRGDSDFPGAYGGSPKRGYTYDYEQVKEWARRRHASRKAIEGEK